VLSLFEEQVQAKPDAVALRYAGTTLTYRQLDEKSNRLAYYLTEQYNVRPGDLVGIMADRSEKMIIAILGILKAGGAYVPIDPAYPRARREYIITDTDIRVLITQTDYIFDIDYYTGAVFAIDAQLEGLPEAPTPNWQAAPKDRAYVIYTSGSTGQPKGCAITHGNLSHYIQWANNYYFHTATGSFGLYTSLSFDLTVTSIFCSLTRGTSLKVYEQDAELTDILGDTFRQGSGIDTVKLTPSHINLLQHLDLQGSGVLCAIVGGEAVSPEHVRILKTINPAMAIYNEYGPTETTVGCMIEELQEDQPVLIGRPAYGNSIYILAPGDVLTPIGVAGEICIGGAGVGQGYLNQPALTAKKFVANPFKAGERMYRSGDLGRWLPDGRIEFLGRKDEQVKIRGYRIELAEIESALQSHPDVTAAAVAVQGTSQADRELVAYVAGPQGMDATDLRSWLADRLPTYMVPAHYVQLPELPLTTNGKVDRKRLPAAGGNGMLAATEYVAPRNQTEEKLASIWQEILAKDRIGIRDNFFDLGGHSLTAIRVLGRIRSEFSVDIKMETVFNNATIEFIAQDIVRRRWAVERSNLNIEENLIVTI
jgi:amino acid adenylation domain-containing protein